MGAVLDGKRVSALVKERAALEAERLRELGVDPCLAVILVGANPASQVYVRNKGLACKAAGIRSEQFDLPEATTQNELLELIDKLAAREDIHGILCQLPLPRHIDEQAVLNAIPPHKDADCFHPVNVGLMTIGTPRVLPCTPAGVITLLKEYGIELAGKHCVVIGRSNIVGKPMALLLLQENATVTVCHSRTVDLPSVTRQADVLISAVGRAGFVTADMVKDGAVVVDVGMNRDEDGKLCGDVDYAALAPKCSFITPVPGGVGPMTIATLLQNTLALARQKK
ncbi:MAG: bifunctional methylenetetrahydrofolate dehydrogenase/methenyltetrahydrofolate cyclohydrolase FolD [Clostridium sp.]|jgi:methylenetetrahydrofolate dehydrogenase (NADP+)/methenyltetrahydrofolate cyclohydrolase|nr:bifunctional methylenetetrahydrofolate dehydrogenase/methenyltetrahydrofolate cyclohydrolase FolD [Clostridium sp.]